MKQRTIVVAVMVTMVILGGGYLSSQYGQLANRGPPNLSSSSAQGEQTATALAGSPEVALLFYDFQLNGTTGTLHVVLQNIGTSNTSVSNVYFDGSPFDNSFVMFNMDCAIFGVGHECGITLVFGPASRLAPARGSFHSFAVETAGGDQFEYSVTAGEFGANCGLAHC